jgi:hypothetical protein
MYAYFVHIYAYFSAFLAKKPAYICAYFLHFSVHIIRALPTSINGISCRKRGDAVRIYRIVVGTKTGNVLHLFLLIL